MASDSTDSCDESQSPRAFTARRRTWSCTSLQQPTCGRSPDSSRSILPFAR